MLKPRFTIEPAEDGLRLTLRRRFGLGAVPPESWSRERPEATGAVARLLAAVEDEPPQARAEADGLLLTHALVAMLDDAQARALDLPPTVPYTLRLLPEGRIDQPAFALRAQWLEPGEVPVRARRMGSLLEAGGARYRVPGRLFMIAEAVDAFRRADTTDQAARFEALAGLYEILPEARERFLEVDGYLRAVRVAHAAAFSLHLRTGRDGFDVDPVLFGRRVRARHEEEPEATVSEAESLLTPHEQAVFAARFRTWPHARACYPIEAGTFVFLDPELERALAVIREVQQASPAERQRLARNPQAVIKERLGAHGTATEAAVEAMFVETEQYSARVTGVGIWAPPVLPWLKPVPNDWLPESFGLRIGDELLRLEREDLPVLRGKCEAAQARGAAAFEHDGRAWPATDELLAAIQRLESSLTPPETARVGETPAGEAGAASAEKLVLLVEEHHEQVVFRKEARPRRADPPEGGPLAPATALKPHQEEGLAWLRRAWLEGASGVLLADDMGLGKTLQALAFLFWLRQVRKGPAPLLVVAPTGLLANWQKEHDLHLPAPGLGRICLAYGAHLARLREGRGTDIERGGAGLDTRALAEADWVLTTYETMRDYQHSFGAVRFAAGVLDEMQKVKNPAALVTQAAKALHLDFVVGLTGTPVENRLEDLWSIFDVVDPGRLGALKRFSQTYRPEDRASLERLRSELLEPQAGREPAILRRFKSQELQGLPRKHERPMPAAMSPEQAEAYHAAVLGARAGGGRGAILEALHALRGISLHPCWPDYTALGDPERYIAASARLSTTVRLLDEIAAEHEKALVFVESLDMQDLLAELLHRRYRLRRRPLQIKGDVPGANRQKAVDLFQAERGFDVMLLTPKAGGVGLTLTAANHVIHLSRWWNPAVEDQCTDRIYRIGQEKDCFVYYPMAMHPAYPGASFDEILHRLLERKRALARELLVPPVDLERDSAELFQAVVGDMPETRPSTARAYSDSPPSTTRAWPVM
jgi:superfamily II DNA or RNA helicase